MPYSDDLLHWQNELPSLSDLGGQPGTPGKQYLYCDSAHEAEAQAAGWSRVGKFVFTLQGPLGTCPFVVMEKGTKAAGLSPNSTSQPVAISQHLLNATGLELTEDCFVDGLPCFTTPIEPPKVVEPIPVAAPLPATPKSTPPPVVEVI